MGKGFKKLPFDWRSRVMELNGANLKVWLFYYWRSDKSDTVAASNPQVAAEAHLNIDTVKIAKAWLKRHGWLTIDTETYRDPVTKRWSIPIFLPLYPRWVSP